MRLEERGTVCREVRMGGRGEHRPSLRSPASGARQRKNQESMLGSPRVDPESRLVRVMISSAQEELLDVRSVLRTTLLQSGFEPLLFEGEGARDESPVEVAEDLVRRCDIYVAVLWTRNSKPTLRELKLAESLRRPVLVYARDGEWEGRDKLIEQFAGPDRKRHVYATFKDASDLAAKLLPAVSRAVVRELGKRSKRSSTILYRLRKEASQLLSGARLFRLSENGVLPVKIVRATRLGDRTVLLLESVADAALVPGLRLDVFRNDSSGNELAGTLDVVDLRAGRYSVGTFVPTSAGAAWWAALSAGLEENQARELGGGGFLRLNREEQYRDPETYFALSADKIKKEFGL